jgi:hypothetical protein
MIFLEQGSCASAHHNSSSTFVCDISKNHHGKPHTSSSSAVSYSPEAQSILATRGSTTSTDPAGETSFYHKRSYLATKRQPNNIVVGSDDGRLRILLNPRAVLKLSQTQCRRQRRNQTPSLVASLAPELVAIMCTYLNFYDVLVLSMALGKSYPHAGRVWRTNTPNYNVAVCNLPICRYGVRPTEHTRLSKVVQRWPNITWNIHVSCPSTWHNSIAPELGKLFNNRMCIMFDKGPVHMTLTRAFASVIKGLYLSLGKTQTCTYNTPSMWPRNVAFVNCMKLETVQSGPDSLAHHGVVDTLYFRRCVHLREICPRLCSAARHVSFISMHHVVDRRHVFTNAQTVMIDGGRVQMHLLIFPKATRVTIGTTNMCDTAVSFPAATTLAILWHHDHIYIHAGITSVDVRYANHTGQLHFANPATVRHLMWNGMHHDCSQFTHLITLTVGPVGYCNINTHTRRTADRLFHRPTERWPHLQKLTVVHFRHGGMKLVWTKAKGYEYWRRKKARSKWLCIKKWPYTDDFKFPDRVWDV